MPIMAAEIVGPREIFCCAGASVQSSLPQTITFDSACNRVDTGEPAAALTVPPPAAAPPDLDALVAALATLGVDVLAPPPIPTEA